MRHAENRTAELRPKTLNARAAAHPPNAERGVIFLQTAEQPRLTRAQREVVEMLLEVPQPSQREMARRLGVTLASIVDRLAWLEKKGAIRRNAAYKTCAITVLRPLAIWPAELVTRNGVQLGKVRA